MRRRWRLWLVAAPVWAGVVLTVIAPYAASPPLWLVGGLALLTVALAWRRTRWLALMAPATGLLIRSSETSLPSQVLAVAAMLGTALCVAVLDGWDLCAPARNQSALVRSDADWAWLRERALGLLPAVATCLVVAVGWIVLASLSWNVGGWLVLLTPALLAAAVAAATHDLWWRPRRDSNPRPPP